jgi:LL-diaminopimelate aminotransferase
MKDTKLSHWRKQIDELDTTLLDALSKRMDIVFEIGKFKKEQKLTPRDDTRWQEILNNSVSHSGKNLSHNFITKLFTLIHREALSIEGESDKNSTSASDRLNNVPEYIFSRLSKMVATVEKNTGKKVLNLGPGSPDVPPSKKYIGKLIEYIQNRDAHTYPPYGASKDFSDALIQWYSQRFGVSISQEEILPLVGAKDGVAHLPLALINEGDEVLIPDPGYPAFTNPLLMVGGVPVFYDLTETNNFKIDLSSLEKKVTAKTKMMWVNFPSNPTGQVVTHKELEGIVAFAKRHNIILIYDNAYSEITFDGFKAPSILEIEGAHDIAVEIGSFSKSFSFAGFRMGWIVGNRTVLSALAKTKSQIDSGLSMPLQHLGAYALTHQDTLWHTRMVANYKKRRDIIAKHLKTLGLTFSLSPGSLYIWAKIPDSSYNSETFAMDLLTNKQILVTPGTAFGQNGTRYVRVSICVNIDKIGEYFS